MPPKSTEKQSGSPPKQTILCNCCVHGYIDANSVCRRQEEGRGRQEGCAERHPRRPEEENPHVDHLPPPKDLETPSQTQIPAQGNPLRAQTRPLRRHPIPTQLGERHEEDRGEQHVGLHRRCQGKQAPDQAGHQEVI